MAKPEPVAVQPDFLVHLLVIRERALKWLMGW